MKIGIMLRHFGQHGGGVLVYTHNLLKFMIEMPTNHEFVLMYKDRDFLGTFSEATNVTEELVPGRSKLAWDQVSVRNCHKRHAFDVIFNPKYSVPLSVDCATVFVCHGLDWYVMPSGSKLADRLNHRYLIPRYAKKAAGIVAVSETARGHLTEYLGVDPAKTSTAHLGVEDRFLEPVDRQQVGMAARKFGLPKRYFFYCGQIYPPKNFGRIVRAFAKVGPANGLGLVVAGTHTWLCEDEIAEIDKLGLRDHVHMLGWVGREDLPSLYTGAEALLLPSLYEACPSPILEAMATGCPIVTANRFGTQELAGDAAVLVDPESVDDIAHGMARIISDSGLRGSLIGKGRERIKQFSWQTCARRTVDAIENAASFQ